MGWVVPRPETCLLAVPGSPSLDGVPEGEQTELRGCKSHLPAIPWDCSPGSCALGPHGRRMKGTPGLGERLGTAPALLQGFGAPLGAALHAHERSGAAFPK